MGICSDAASVRNASRRLLSPATGQPYEVIVGVSTVCEAARAVWDHFYAGQTAAALRSALKRQFGGDGVMVAQTLDTHSNGAPIGVTALERGVIRGVREIHMMGPDTGFQGQYVDRARLLRLHGGGVASVDIYRVRGDVVPYVGQLTDQVADVTVAAVVEPIAYVTRLARGEAPASRPAAPAAPPPVAIRYHDFGFTGRPDALFQPHWVATYIAQRLARSQDPDLIARAALRMGPAVFEHLGQPRVPRTLAASAGAP
jgi:hypothetical protein